MKTAAKWSLRQAKKKNHKQKQQKITKRKWIHLWTSLRQTKTRNEEKENCKVEERNSHWNYYYCFDFVLSVSLPTLFSVWKAKSRRGGYKHLWNATKWCSLSCSLDALPIAIKNIEVKQKIVNERNFWFRSIEGQTLEVPLTQSWFIDQRTEWRKKVIALRFDRVKDNAFLNVTLTTISRAHRFSKVIDLPSSISNALFVDFRCANCGSAVVKQHRRMFRGHDNFLYSFYPFDVIWFVIFTEANQCMPRVDSFKNAFIFHSLVFLKRVTVEIADPLKQKCMTHSVDKSATNKRRERSGKERNEKYQIADNDKINLF